MRSPEVWRGELPPEAKGTGKTPQSANSKSSNLVRKKEKLGDRANSRGNFIAIFRKSSEEQSSIFHLEDSGKTAINPLGVINA